MRNKAIKYMVQSAIAAALYAALSLTTIPLGPFVQFRISEALCILPCFMPAAAPGLFLGCLITNIYMNANILDIIFGSLATLIGALCTLKIKNKFLAPIPTVISNTVIIPVIIVFAYMTEEARNIEVYLLNVLGVFVGEVLSAYVLGILLYTALEKQKNIFK